MRFFVAFSDETSASSFFDDILAIYPRFLILQNSVAFLCLKFLYLLQCLAILLAFIHSITSFGLFHVILLKHQDM
jgi:hypothetical protein